MWLRHAASLLQVVPVQQFLLRTDEGQGPSARALRGAMEGSSDNICINISRFTTSNIIARMCQHKFMLYRWRCRLGNKLSDM